jgi:hypothetical protein
MVDDEIREGNTMYGVFRLFSMLGTSVARCAVVAEDGGFECPDTLGNTKIEFIPTKKRIPDIYNAISYITPPTYAQPTEEALRDELDVPLNSKHIMCTLLGLPVKERPDGRPNYTTRLIQKAGAAIVGFSELQHNYTTWFNQTIHNNLIKS